MDDGSIQNSSDFFNAYLVSRGRGRGRRVETSMYKTRTVWLGSDILSYVKNYHILYLPWYGYGPSRTYELKVILPLEQVLHWRGGTAGRLPTRTPNSTPKETECHITLP